MTMGMKRSEKKLPLDLDSLFYFIFSTEMLSGVHVIKRDPNLSENLKSSFLFLSENWSLLNWQSFQ